ncbi:hypothetical protein Tco_0593895 [Tanacetum coccineum]
MKVAFMLKYPATKVNWYNTHGYQFPIVAHGAERLELDRNEQRCLPSEDNAQNVVVQRLLTPLSRDDLWRDVKDRVVKPDNHHSSSVHNQGTPPYDIIEEMAKTIVSNMSAYKPQTE